MKTFIKFALVIYLFISCNKIYAQAAAYEEKVDTLHFSILFSMNDHFLYSGKSNNSETIHQIDSIVSYYQTNRFICSIDILAFSSFDGQWTKNLSLSEERALAVRDHLLNSFNFMKETTIQAKGMGEDWIYLKEIVLNDPQIPAQKQVIAIIDDERLNYDQKELKIKQLDQGAAFRYMTLNVLPLLRRTDIQMITHYQNEIPDIPQQEEIPDTPQQEEVTEQKEAVEAPEAIENIEVAKNEPQPESPVSYSPRWAAKTNLLYLSADVFNAGVEYSWEQHFSLDVPVTYSPYTIKRDWRIRTLSIQPEIRWWPDCALKGHFMGLHFHTAYYNISTNNTDRYQDKNRRTPLWGFGLSYGYAFLLKNHWNMEITIGAGYARLDYDVFYNVTNGALYDTRTKNYWGITRAGINLIYQFTK